MDTAMADSSENPSDVISADPTLELHEIQGDVVVGLQKNCESFLFFNILDVPGFKAALAGRIISRITTAEVALLRETQIQQHKATRGQGLLSLNGLNLGLTYGGLATLLGYRPGGLDSSFEAGAAERAKSLNDPVDSVGSPISWKPAFHEDRIHGVFLLTGPDASAVDENAQDLIRALGGTASVVHAELGRVRPDRGHEHFGFRDGVSQPGIRGLTTRLDLRNPNYGFPGQDLLWPGELVFGYAKQGPQDPQMPGAVATTPIPWLRNSSYMVFRRLIQKVPEFRTYVAEQSLKLGVDAELLAARLMGRWRSGAPLVLAPIQDEPTLGRDPARNNDFLFWNDLHQRRCPFAAHIRKANPRDDLGNQNQILMHRMRRSGIPFGPEVGPEEVFRTREERGLLFVSYQTSILDQFEFIQSKWLNSPTFPFRKARANDGSPITPGPDPIVGQSVAHGIRAREVDEPIPNYPFGNVRSTLSMPTDFVVPTGGGYFLMPSISALQVLTTHAFKSPQEVHATKIRHRKGTFSTSRNRY
jgi:Dyp-type peroxidase family